MDDMLMFGPDRASVVEYTTDVTAFVAEQLQLEVKAPVIAPVTRGIPFLGFLTRPEGLYITRKKRRRAAARIREYARYFHSQQWNEEKLADHLLPLFSHLALARSRTVRNNLIQRAGLRQ